MNQIQIEILTPVEFCRQFNNHTYSIGVHSVDSDLAKLLVRVKAARYIIPRKTVPISKP